MCLPSRVGSSSADTPATPHLVGTSFFELSVRQSIASKRTLDGEVFLPVCTLVVASEVFDSAYTSKYFIFILFI